MEKETKEWLDKNGYTEEDLKHYQKEKEFIQNETKQIPRIWISAMSIGFDVNSTLLPYNNDGIPIHWLKSIKRLNNDNKDKEKACKSVLYFLQSRFPSRRQFLTGSDNFFGDNYILTKGCRTAKVEFPSLMGDRTFTISPKIWVTPEGDAVLQIKEKGSHYVGYFVITDESKLLPDIETIVTDESLTYPALSEQRKLLRKERPDLQFSEDVLIAEKMACVTIS